MITIHISFYAAACRAISIARTKRLRMLTKKDGFTVATWVVKIQMGFFSSRVNTVHCLLTSDNAFCSPIPTITHLY